MACVKSNGVKLTTEEAVYFNAKLDLIITPQEWMDVVKEMYTLANVDLHLNWSPEFTYHKTYNGVIPCFKGRVSGKNINRSGLRSPEVYSLSVAVGDSYSDSFHRGYTGTGGGGDNCYTGISEILTTNPTNFIQQGLSCHLQSHQQLTKDTGTRKL